MKESLNISNEVWNSIESTLGANFHSNSTISLERAKIYISRSKEAYEKLRR